VVIVQFCPEKVCPEDGVSHRSAAEGLKMTICGFGAKPRSECYYRRLWYEPGNQKAVSCDTASRKS
jgi:hypothetical protein